MLCDIEVQDTPTVVTDDEKTIERAEGDRRNREEVHRGNRFTVIPEKGKPAPSRLRISRRSFHPTRDCSLRDIKAEHEKLAMDARRSPRGVLNDHSEDQFLNLLRRLFRSSILVRMATIPHCGDARNGGALAQGRIPFVLEADLQGQGAGREGPRRACRAGLILAADADASVRRVVDVVRDSPAGDPDACARGEPAFGGIGR